MGKVQTFIENKIIGGYSLAVRDDWSFKIKRVNITEEEKQAYQKEFGDEILTYSDFLNWWLKYNNLEDYVFKKNKSKIKQQ